MYLMFKPNWFSITYLELKEGLKDMGEGAKESFKDARSNIGEKRQGKAVNYYYVR